MPDRNLGDTTNIHDVSRVSRSTPAPHESMKGSPVKLRKDPTGAVSNGSKVKNIMPRSSESKRAQRTSDYDI